MKQTTEGVEFSTADTDDKRRAIDLFNALVYARIDGFSGAVPGPNTPIDVNLQQYRLLRGAHSVLVIPNSEVPVARIALQNLALLDEAGRLNPSVPEQVKQFDADLAAMFADTPVH